MDARVKPESRYGSITAFSGLEFVKTEWRSVPEGKEEEAKRNPYLELKGGEKEKEQPSLAKMRGVEDEQPSLESLRGVEDEPVKETEGEVETEEVTEPEPEKAAEPKPKAKAPAKKSKSKKG